MTWAAFSEEVEPFWAGVGVTTGVLVGRTVAVAVTVGFGVGAAVGFAVALGVDAGAALCVAVGLEAFSTPISLHTPSKRTRTEYVAALPEHPVMVQPPAAPSTRCSKTGHLF